jgi:hypothetical protein
MKKVNNKKTHDDDLGELNLVDFLIVLLKYKKLIISIPMICALIGIGYFYIAAKLNVAILQPESGLSSNNVKYYSECLIEPIQNNEKRINLILLRRNFVLNMLEENGLLADVHKVISDEKKPEQIQANQIDKIDIYRWFRKNIYIFPTGDVITIGFTASEKDIPPKVIGGILYSLNNFFGKIDLETITQELNGLGQQLSVTKDPKLKEKMSEKIVAYLQDEIKIKKSKQYVFKLLDPPTLSEKVKVFGSGNDRKIESLESWIGTSPLNSNLRSKHIISRYILIIFLIIISSFTVAITIAFFREYLLKMKTNDPRKIAELKKHLSIRQKPPSHSD